MNLDPEGTLGVDTLTATLVKHHLSTSMKRLTPRPRPSHNHGAGQWHRGTLVTAPQPHAIYYDLLLICEKHIPTSFIGAHPPHAAAPLLYILTDIISALLHSLESDQVETSLEIIERLD